MNIANHPSPNPELVWVNNVRKAELISNGFKVYKSKNVRTCWIFLVNRQKANKQIEKQVQEFQKYRKSIGLN